MDVVDDLGCNRVSVTVLREGEGTYLVGNTAIILQNVVVFKALCSCYPLRNR